MATSVTNNTPPQPAITSTKTHKQTQENPSFLFSGKNKQQEEHTKKLRLKSERGLQQTEEKQNKTKQNKRETPAMQQNLSYLQTKQTALSFFMCTRENGCEKATRRDSKKRCTDHSLGT
jgi:hypothetical protein